MKISECVIAWTPMDERYPAGMRGKLRLFSATAGQDEMTPFPCRAGRFDARAQDPRREAREAYVMMVALMATQRDGLDVASVHQLLLQIEEYRSGCAPELLSEAACP
jgi:hypothetical protein